MEKNLITIIEGMRLPDIINMINTGNITDTETNVVDVENIIISNGDVIVKPVINQIQNEILECLKFGISNNILVEEPEEFETECLQYVVFKYDETEKTFLSFDLWEFLQSHNFINENFEFIIDLEDSQQDKIDKNIALINNWTAYGWL